MRDPDFVMTDESAGPDRVVVDAHFGGAFRPFRMLIFTDRKSVMEAAEFVMRDKAAEFRLWNEREQWRNSLIGSLLKDALRHIGEPQQIPSFNYGISCRLCVRDRTCRCA